MAAPIDVGAQPVGVAAVVAGDERERVGRPVQLHQHAGAKLLALAREVGRQVAPDIDVERLHRRVGLVVHEAQQRELRRAARLVGAGEALRHLLVEKPAARSSRSTATSRSISFFTIWSLRSPTGSRSWNWS